MMAINMLVTKENRLEWDEAFKLTSMERCLSLLSLSGIPSVMLEHPFHLIEVSRRYVRSQYLKNHVNLQAALESQHFDIIEAFAQLEKAYSQELAQGLYQWFTLFILNSSLSGGWDGWSTLLYRICELNKGNLHQLPLSSQIQICGCIDIKQHRLLMQQLRQRVKSVELLPSTDWEKWLEDKVAYAAGDGDIVGVVEAGLTEVVLITDNYLIQQALKTIRQTLNIQEQIDLLQWMRIFSDEMGLPTHLIEIAWDACKS